MSARRGGAAVAVAIAAVAVGIAAVVFIFIGRPKSAPAQLEHARQLAREAAAAPAGLEREDAIRRAVDAYDAVAAFPDEPPAHEDALRDAAGFLAREGRYADAEDRVKRLLARAPPPADAGALRLRLGEWRERAGDWKGARAAYRAAAEADPAAKEAAEAAFRAAVLLEERIEDAPKADVIADYERFLREHPRGERAPEALWRLARIYRSIDENGRALAAYRRLADEHPKSEFAARALREIARIYGEELDRPREAAKALEELEKKHPESEAARGARAERREQERKASERDRKEYEESHYGGRVADLGDLIPRPPREALAELIATRLDVRRIEADVTLAPAQGRIAVVARLALAHGGAGPRRDVLLAMEEGLEIEAARFGGEPAAVEREGDMLRVRAAKEWPAGEERMLELRYGGTPGEATPWLKVGPEGGYGIGASGWLPGGVLGDLFTCAVTFEAPAGYEVVATGKRAGEPGAARWESEVPVYGLYFAFGRFTTAQGEWRGRPISVHARTEGFARAEEFLAEARAILDFYADRFGDIPWPKLAIVECDLPPIIAGVGPASLLLLERKAFAAGAGLPRNLMAHELAHQWWGNVIPPTLAEGYAPWLSEGLATYSDALYFESREGSEAARRHLAKYASLYYEIVLHAPDQALDDAWMASPAYRAIAYEKAARTLHMVRYAVGDDAFCRGLRRYAEKNRFQDTTSATLREALEAESGADLAGFFEDWTKRPGFARLRLEKVRAREGEKAGAGGGATFEIEADVAQDDPPFRIPAVEIRFFEAGGRAEGRRAAVAKAAETFRLTLPFRPVRAALDPDDHILKLPGPATEWPAQPTDGREERAVPR